MNFIAACRDEAIIIRYPAKLPGFFESAIIIFLENRHIFGLYKLTMYKEVTLP
jgi:hypothetical protein